MKILTIALRLTCFAISCVASLGAAPSSRESFNDGWRFHRGRAPDAGEALSYLALKPYVTPTGNELLVPGYDAPQRPEGNPGAHVSFVQAGFDDSGWQSVKVPHDWAIAGPFDQDLPGETGKLPWQGVGWYRKTFDVPAEDEGMDLALDIDGSMAYSSVWVNGEYVGGWPYGYTSYRLDLSPHINYGSKNYISIRLENLPESSRWYPGSGLYRDVWLVKQPKLRFRQWGIFARAPSVMPKLANLKVDAYVENRSGSKRNFEIAADLYLADDEGRKTGPALVTAAPVSLELDPERASEAMRSFHFAVEDPKLWSLDSTQRYVVVTRIREGRQLVDQQETPIGIRSIEWHSEKGVILNGERVELKGVCMHHDLGALGAAFNTRAAERQIEILQEMGCNSIRTSHNPPAPEFLELCDRMGMLVMVEAFDCWRIGKKDRYRESPERFEQFHDYARVWDDWYEKDLRATVRRDRNHPSVFAWSIGNEVLEQWYADGWQLATRLAGIVREEDRSRAVTGGFNNDQAGFVGFQTAVDTVGFNYKYWAYSQFHERNPEMPVYGAETASTLSSRGEYAFPVSDDKLEGRANFHVSSYDLSAAPWSSPPDVEFKALDEAPYASGEYVWTGFDYLGEPTPYNSDTTNLLNFSNPGDQARIARELEELGRIRVPSRSSYFGILDLAGFRKDRFYIYQARWRPDLPMAHILPHWNWPDRLGEVTPVHVYSSGDEAELFLNGESLGRRARGPREYRFRWDDARYQPGILKVVTYKDGQPWAEAIRETAGAPAALRLSVDRDRIEADGEDLAFITVEILDKQGRFVPTASDEVTFSVKGAGALVATDNGDPTSHVSFASPTRPVFNGLALAIVRGATNEPGVIEVGCSAKGLESDSLRIQIR